MSKRLVIKNLEATKKNSSTFYNFLSPPFYFSFDSGVYKSLAYLQYLIFYFVQLKQVNLVTHSVIFPRNNRHPNTIRTGHLSQKPASKSEIRKFSRGQYLITLVTTLSAPHSSGWNAYLSFNFLNVSTT